MFPFPLVESIKLNDGIICLLEYHQQRLHRSMDELFPNASPIDLHKELSSIELPSTGLFKIRVIYGAHVEKIEIHPYVHRPVKCLKVVADNKVDYHLKYTDRQMLHSLYSQREGCDDIIIVKTGLVTDAFSSNLLFYDGQRWFTSDSPLLKGTQRQHLLDTGLITERLILAEQLVSFRKVGLINAMIDFDEMPIIDIKDVHL